MSTGTASTVKQIKRPATKQVWDWRHNFYDFRKAKRLVEQNRTRDALPYLEGPHASYVRSRFRAIGNFDKRFIAALALVGCGERADLSRPIFQPVADAVPVLHVSPEIADAFGMHGLPNTVIDLPGRPELLATPAHVPSDTLAREPLPPTNQPGAVHVNRADLLALLKPFVKSIPTMPKHARDRANKRLPEKLAPRIQLRADDASKNVLHVHALDFPEIAPVSFSACQVDSPLVIAVPLRLLLDILKNEAAEVLDFATPCVPANTLVIKSRDAEYKLVGIHAVSVYTFDLPRA